MRDLAELRINEGGRPVDQPAPDPALLKELERYLGVALPGAYVDLLNHSNGGHPELDSFVVKSGESQERWSVNRFYHLTADKESIGTVWKALRDWKAVLDDRALPFANDGGGNQIYLSLDREPCAVKLCIHDEGFRILDVADSLEEFVDMLEVDPDAI